MSAAAATPEFKPNLEKLRKLESQAGSIIIGGKVRVLLE